MHGTGPEPAPPTGGGEPIGTMLARVRAARGISQLRLAELLCAASGQATVTRHEVSRWERAERVPSAHWLRWLAIALELPVAELEAAARLSRSGQPVPTRTDRLLWTTPDAAELGRLLDQGGADLSRLAHAWLARQRGAVRPAPGTAATSSGPPGGQILDRLAIRLDDLRRTDDLVGGADLADTVLGELRAALRLLSAHRPTRRLLGLVAGLAQLAGWTAGDAGRREVACRAYGVGLATATAAGDRALGAHLLGCLSHLVVERDPAEALLLARTAYAGARHTGASGLQALLLHRVAFAAALGGERRTSEAALAAAERVADRRAPDREPEWLYWLDAAELVALAGRCFAALRRPMRAEPLLRQRWDRAVTPQPTARARPGRGAVDAAPPTPGPRTVAIDGGWLAEAYLDAGEVEQACSVAQLAVVAAIRSGSPRAAARALSGRSRLVAARTGSAARAFAGLLAAAEPYLPRPGRAGQDRLVSG